MDSGRFAAKIRSVATAGDAYSPSVARSLTQHEADDLIATAKGLPPTWCVQILPPWGQVAISPLGERRRHVRCHTASLAWGCIRHEPHRR